MILPIVLAALLSATADAVPVIVTSDFKGPGTEHLKKKPFEAVPGPGSVEFTIHVRTDHDPIDGTLLRLWITPGMSEDAAAQKACGDRHCRGESPDRDEIRRLFVEALNEALRENEKGFGHYRITNCDEPPKPRDKATFGWFEVAGKYDLRVDLRRLYEVANAENGRWEPTQYALAAREVKNKRVKFTPPDRIESTDGLNHVWGFCADNKKLDLILLVTQLQNTVLRKETTAGQAKTQ